MFFSGTAASATTSFHCFGTAQTSTADPTAALCEVGLTANERAALFHGVAVGDDGSVLEVVASGAMVPEEGWQLRCQSGDLALVLSGPLTVSLEVTGPAQAWSGWLEITFTQNYSV